MSATLEPPTQLAMRGVGSARRDVELCAPRQTPPQIDLWVISLDVSATYLASCAQILSSDEWNRAARCGPPRRAEFIVTRAGLRQILGRYVGRDPAHLVFESSPSGNLRLVNSPLHFNAAHTDGLALLAVSFDDELGVDVERIRPIARAIEIAERFFSSSDAAAVRSAPSHLRSEAFLRRWTVVEARLKSHGRGLGDWSAKFSGSVAAARWIHMFRPAAGYIGALAVARPGSCVTHHRFTPFAETEQV